MCQNHLVYNSSISSRQNYTQQETFAIFMIVLLEITKLIIITFLCVFIFIQWVIQARRLRILQIWYFWLHLTSYFPRRMITGPINNLNLLFPQVNTASVSSSTSSISLTPPSRSTSPQQWATPIFWRWPSSQTTRRWTSPPSFTSGSMELRVAWMEG